MTVPAIPNSATTIEALHNRAAEYQARSRSEATKRVYRFAWADFSAFCAERGLTSMPSAPSTVAAYLAWLADNGQKLSTIGKKLAAISVAHQTAGVKKENLPTRSVEVKLAMEGITRTLGRDPYRQMEPLLTADIRAMLAHMGDDTKGIRDRALVLLTYAGAFRRGEVLSLAVADLEFGDEGVVVTLKRSKTAQSSSRRVAVPFGAHEETCPVRALKRWLEAAKIAEGAVFRSVDKAGRVSPNRLGDEGFAKVLKGYAAKVGLNPAKIGCHSLRAGHATAAHSANAPSVSILRQGGWSSVNMLARYVRGDLFTQNSSKYLGL